MCKSESLSKIMTLNFTIFSFLIVQILVGVGRLRTWTHIQLCMSLSKNEWNQNWNINRGPNGHQIRRVMSIDFQVLFIMVELYEFFLKLTISDSNMMYCKTSVKFIILQLESDVIYRWVQVPDWGVAISWIDNRYSSRAYSKVRVLIGTILLRLGGRAAEMAKKLKEIGVDTQCIRKAVWSPSQFRKQTK